MVDAEEPRAADHFAGDLVDGHERELRALVAEALGRGEVGIHRVGRVDPLDGPAPDGRVGETRGHQSGSVAILHRLEADDSSVEADRLDHHRRWESPVRWWRRPVGGLMRGGG